MFSFLNQKKKTRDGGCYTPSIFSALPISNISWMRAVDPNPTIIFAPSSCRVLSARSIVSCGIKSAEIINAKTNPEIASRIYLFSHMVTSPV